MNHNDKCDQAMSILKAAGFIVYDRTSMHSADQGWEVRGVRLNQSTAQPGETVEIGTLSWNFYESEEGSPFAIENKKAVELCTPEQAYALRQAENLFK